MAYPCFSQSLDKAINSYHFETSPSKLHTQALDFLTQDQRGLGMSLLYKNFYENSSLASYKFLKSMEAQPSLAPFLFQMSIFLWIVFSAVLLIVLWKDRYKIQKILIYFSLWMSSLFILFCIGFFVLDKRVSNTKDCNLFNAASKQALVLGTLEAGSDVRFLKSQGEWIQIQNSKGQKSWVLGENFIETWSAY